MCSRPFWPRSRKKNSRRSTAICRTVRRSRRQRPWRPCVRRRRWCPSRLRPRPRYVRSRARSSLSPVPRRPLSLSSLRPPLPPVRRPTRWSPRRPWAWLLCSARPSPRRPPRQPWWSSRPWLPQLPWPGRLSLMVPNQPPQQRGRRSLPPLHKSRFKRRLRFRPRLRLPSPPLHPRRRSQRQWRLRLPQFLLPPFRPRRKSPRRLRPL